VNEDIARHVAAYQSLIRVARAARETTAAADKALDDASKRERELQKALNEAHDRMMLAIHAVE
jgi:hypothetical protein